MHTQQQLQQQMLAAPFPMPLPPTAPSAAGEPSLHLSSSSFASMVESFMAQQAQALTQAQTELAHPHHHQHPQSLQRPLLPLPPTVAGGVAVAHPSMMVHSSSSTSSRAYSLESPYYPPHDLSFQSIPPVGLPASPGLMPGQPIATHLDPFHQQPQYAHQLHQLQQPHHYPQQPQQLPFPTNFQTPPLPTLPPTFRQ